MLYMASQSDLLIFLDLNASQIEPRFSNNKPGTTHFLLVVSYQLPVLF